MTPTGIPELVLRLVALGGITAAATWAVIELKSREHECGTSAVFKKQILKRGQKESDWSCAGLDEIARICVAEGSYRTLHARWWGRWRCLFAWRGPGCQCAVRNLGCRRVEHHSLIRIQIEVQHPLRLAVLNPETGRAELHWRDSDAVSEASHPWSGPCLLPIHIKSAGRTDR